MLRAVRAAGFMLIPAPYDRDQAPGYGVRLALQYRLRPMKDSKHLNLVGN